MKVVVNTIRTDSKRSQSEQEKQNFTVKESRSSDHERERQNFTSDE